MCGIVGYIGTQQAAPLLLEGLTRLEHRGYDSAGVAVQGSGGIRVAKKAGRVRDLADGLPKRFAGKAGIGHTRWATHGPANDVNAHPHTDVAGSVAVVHNGIIDNASALRAELADGGVDLASDTDTEVIAHLIARSTADTLESRVAEALAAGTGDRVAHRRPTPADQSEPREVVLGHEHGLARVGDVDDVDVGDLLVVHHDGVGFIAGIPRERAVDVVHVSRLSHRGGARHRGLLPDVTGGQPPAVPDVHRIPLGEDPGTATAPDPVRSR